MRLSFHDAAILAGEGLVDDSYLQFSELRVELPQVACLFFFLVVKLGFPLPDTPFEPVLKSHSKIGQASLDVLCVLP